MSKKQKHKGTFIHLHFQAAEPNNRDRELESGKTTKKTKGTKISREHKSE